MKYLVLCDCYGFQGRLWEKGAIVDIDVEEQPPHHFQPLGEKPKVEAQAESPASNDKRPVIRKRKV
jgi:hypothetical protein